MAVDIRIVLCALATLMGCVVCVCVCCRAERSYVQCTVVCCVLLLCCVVCVSCVLCCGAAIVYCVLCSVRCVSLISVVRVVTEGTSSCWLHNWSAHYFHDEHNSQLGCFHFEFGVLR